MQIANKELDIKKIKDYIYESYDYKSLSFNFSPSNNIKNLYTTCFGIMCLDLIGELKSFPDAKKLISKIQSYQDEETGYFVDRTLLMGNRKFNDEYIYLQATDFAQIALSCFNETPSHPYHFLEKYKNRKYLTSWLENLNWDNPWLISNKIMFVLNSFIYENEVKNKEYITHILDWLDNNQNQETGYWDINNNTSYFRQMAGAYHYLFFYTYFDRQINFLEKIIDSTLKIQNKDGLFSYSGGGGSCDDLDAIDILCRASFSTNYRKDDIKKALYKSYLYLRENQNRDGGFCWAKRGCVRIGKLKSIFNFNLWKNTSKYDYFESLRGNIQHQVLALFYPRMLVWRYSGLKTMQIPYESSDLFSTWFRLTSIAFIETTYPTIVGDKKSVEWNLRTKSGLGFYKKTI